MKSATRFLTLVCWGIVLLNPPESFSQERLTAPKIRKIYVPKDKPESWPEGDWTPLSPDRLEELLAAPRSRDERQSAGWFQKAYYSATFQEGVLSAGWLELEIEPDRISFDSSAQYAPWDEVNVALSGLAWDAREAELGSTSEGRAFLVIPSGVSKLKGEWSFGGRKISSGYHFRLKLPSSAVSSMDLFVPSNRELMLPQKQPVRESFDSETDLRRYQIALGSSSELEFLVISTPNGRATASNRGLYTHAEASFVLSRNEFRFQQELPLESLDVPRSEISIPIPEGFEIRSVEWGGTAIESWVVTDSEPSSLKISFPSPLQGSSRPLRIIGVASFSLEQELSIPRLVPEEAIALSEELSLSVAPPLELKSIDHGSGYRQVSASSGPDGSSVLKFQRLFPNPSLRFRVGQPESRIQASLLTHLERRRGRFFAESHIDLRMSTGSTFQVSLLVAPGWDPIQVELIEDSNSTRTNPIAWQLVESNRGRRQLDIDLPRSLSRGKPVALRVSARSLSPDPIDIPLPLLQLDDSIRAEQRLVVSREVFSTTDFEALEQWSRANLSELPTEFAQTRTLRALDLQPEQFLLYYSDAHSESRLLIPEPKSEYEVHVTDRIHEQTGHFDEEAHIGIVIPEGSQSVASLILTCVGDTQELNWKLIDRPDVNLHVRSEVVRMADGRTQVVLEFDPPIQKSATVAVRRQVDVQGLASRTFDALLPFCAEAERFTGTVSLQSELAGIEPLDLRLETSGLSVKPALNPEQEVWSADYTDEAATLEVPPIRSSADREPEAAYLALDSSLLGTGAGQFIHRLDVQLSGSVQQLAYRFPDTDYSVLVNGVPVAPIEDPSGAPTRLFWNTAQTNSTIVTFQYRTDATLNWDNLISSIPIPELSVDRTFFRWTLSLPPGVHPQRFPEGIRANSTLYEPLLSRRLFGPVGRNHQNQFFDPLSRQKWSQVLSPPSQSNRESQDGIPADWSRYQFSSDRAPSELTISFWSEVHQTPIAWGVLIATVFTICVLRITQQSARRMIACWWFLFIATLAMYVPSSYAVYSGALFFGSLVSILIPRSLLLGREFLDEKSTAIQLPEDSTISKPAIVGMFLICLSLGGNGSAQESRTNVETVKSIDILVPYKDSKEPIQSSPEFVYVRERDRPRVQLIASRERESILISEIDYHCRIPVSGLVELQAVCQIHIPAGNSRNEVVIPIRGANLAAENACLVDGRPALVSLTKEGFPLIDLKPYFIDEAGNRIDAPLRAPKPGEVSHDPQIREVILNLYPPIDTTQDGTGFSLTVPRVPIGSLWCEFPPEASSRIQLRGARGEVSFEGPGVLSAILGDIDRWEIRIQPEIAVAPLPRVETKSQLFLTAQPAYVRYRYRITHRVLEGRVDHLAWELPSDFDLLRIRGEEILRHTIREESGRRTLLFDLENSLTTDSEAMVIEAEFLAAARSLRDDETELVIPELFPARSRLTNSLDQSIEYVSAGLLVGLSSPPELPLTIVEQQTDRFKSVDPSKFLPTWPEDASLQTPEFCFETQSPAELKFLFTAIRPSREVSVIEQGLISDRTFDWSWTGEIRTSDSPVFEHRFRVDPRLEILSVSVREDQAERDHRWFREADELTVRLGRKTEGLQTITIRGQMPLDDGGNLKLPTFRLLESEYLNSEFDVYRTSRWIVQSELGQPARTEEGDQTYDERERILIKRFTDREDQPVPSLQLTRKTPPLFAQQTVSLRKRSDQNFDISAEIVLSNQSTDPLVLVVPSEWVPRLSHQTGDDHEGNPDLQLLPDGTARMTFASEELSAPLQIKTTLTPPVDGESWAFPFLQFEGNVEASHRLLIRAADGWLPVENCTLNTARSELDRATISALPLGYEEYSIHCDPLELIRADRVDARAVPKIPILINYVLASSEGPFSGRWILLYEGRGASELVLNFPLELTEFDCRLNGVSVPADFDSKERLLTIPFPTGMTSAMIEFRWSTNDRPGDNMVHKISVEGPSSVEIPIERRELVLITDAERRIAMYDGMTIHPIKKTRLELLEQISALLEGTVDSQEDIPHFLPLLMAGLHQSLSEPDLLPPELRQRLKKLELAIPPTMSPLQQQLELGQFSLDYPELLSNSEYSGRTAVCATLPDGEDTLSQTWLISQRWLTILGTIVAGLVILPLLRMLFRSSTSDWLARHRAVSYLCLGSLWWICLDFSLVGLVMASCALVSIVWSLIRPTPQVVVHQN